MSVKFSRSGLRVDLQAGLPFNHNVAVQFQVATGLEDASAAFQIERNTHLWLVRAAASLIQDQGTMGRQLHHLIKPEDAEQYKQFHDALVRALWDADKRAPYNDPVLEVVPVPTWRSHFYDPDTRTNYAGQRNLTAVSQGSRYYRDSLRAYRRGEMLAAGYCLGLSLHYLSDLTQPMHAANFTWLDSQPFGFHTDFEKHVKSILPRIEAPQTYKPPIQQGSTTESHFHMVARYTKDSYFALICKPAWTQHYSEEMRTTAVWERRVGKLIPIILGDAVQNVAQFLMQWAAEAGVASRLVRIERLVRQMSGR
ncbi:MAG: hypothetical protein KF726_17830 [Anaerolineae bacterium]|nr:hypothetical protein [Anaerolineae bacterium]